MRIYAMCDRCRKMIAVDDDSKIDVIIPGRTKGTNFDDIELDDEIALCAKCKAEFDKWLEV